MGNFALGWRNHVFLTPGTWDLATGSIAAGALTDLADMRLSKRVTINGEAALAFGNSSIVLHWYVDEAAAAQIDLIGLLNYAVSAPDDAEAIIIELSVLGVSGDADVENEVLTQWEPPSGDFQRHAWALLPDGVGDGYWVTVHVTCTMGATAGAVSLTLGGLWAGPVWSPPDGIDATWSQAINDPGSMGRSVGNQGYPRRRQRYRSFEGRAIHVPFRWAFGDQADSAVLDIQQLLYRIGATEPIVLFPRTRDAAGELSTHITHRLGIYGHMAEAGRIEHIGGDLYQWTGVRVDELM